MTMVGCSNPVYTNGLYFHLECVALREVPDSETDWWCSHDCKVTNNSAFCLCASHCPGEELVLCSRERDLGTCMGERMYHLECLGIESVPGIFFLNNLRWYMNGSIHEVTICFLLVDNWLCPTCTRYGDQDALADGVLQYSLAATWEGLKDLAQLDAKTMVQPWSQIGQLTIPHLSMGVQVERNTTSTSS